MNNNSNDELPVELSEETVADLDAPGEPAGGLRRAMSSNGPGRCVSDDDITCRWYPTGCGPEGC